MRGFVILSVALCALLLGAPAGAREAVAMPLILARNLWDGFQSALWMEGRERMGSEDVQGYVQGLGSGEDSIMGVKLEGGWDVLEAWIGYLQSAPDGRKSVFEVVADGKVVYRSDPISSEEEPEKIRVPIKGKQKMQLIIRPESYGATAGAAWGAPTLLAGVKAEDLQVPLKLVVDGKSIKLPQQGGKAPTAVPVPLPLKSGITEYRVRMIYDPSRNRVEVETSQAPPASED